MASDVAGCEAYAPGHGMSVVVFIPVFWFASLMSRTLNVFVLWALVRCVEHFGHKGHHLLSTGEAGNEDLRLSRSHHLLSTGEAGNEDLRLSRSHRN